MDPYVLDISVDILEQAATVPGDPPPQRRLIAHHETDGCETAVLCLSAHQGTHLDFPAHFIPGGRRLRDYAPHEFLLPALVWELPDCGPQVGVREFRHCPLRPGEALLCKTANSRTGRAAAGTYSPDFVALTQDGAAWIQEQGAVLLGWDYCSVEPCDQPDFPVHRLLLGAGIRILEGLNLAGVESGRYTLVCAPLKIGAGEAAPVRALLLPAGT